MLHELQRTEKAVLALAGATRELVDTEQSVLRDAALANLATMWRDVAICARRYLGHEHFEASEHFEALAAACDRAVSDEDTDCF